MAQLSRQPNRTASTIGTGVTAILVHHLVSYKVVADALLRYPIEGVKIAKAHPAIECSWLRKVMDAVQDRPEDYDDYGIVQGQLYCTTGGKQDNTP